MRLEATPRRTKLLQEGRRRRVKRLAATLRTLTSDDLELLARAAAIVERRSQVRTAFIANQRLRLAGQGFALIRSGGRESIFRER